MKEHPNNTYQCGNKSVLLSSVFYGANASGKTSVIKALHFMQNYIFNSNNLQINQNIPLKRYCFGDDIKDKPAELRRSSKPTKQLKRVCLIAAESEN